MVQRPGANVMNSDVFHPAADDRAVTKVHQQMPDVHLARRCDHVVEPSGRSNPRPPGGTPGHAIAYVIGSFFGQPDLPNEMSKPLP